MAHQQLASNRNSTSFNNGLHRISKLPKSLIKTKPTLDGKSKKFEFFESLSQTSLKIRNQLTQDDSRNNFQFYGWCCVANIQKISSPTRESLGEILAILRRKSMEPHSITQQVLEIQPRSLSQIAKERRTI